MCVSVCIQYLNVSRHLTAFFHMPYPLSLLKYMYLCDVLFHFVLCSFFFYSIFVSPYVSFMCFPFWISINKRLVLIFQAYEFYYDKQKKNEQGPRNERTLKRVCSLFDFCMCNAYKC